MLARRCVLDDPRSPTYGIAELARLTGVSPKRARASVNKLDGAGLLTWSDQAILFPAGEPLSGPDPAQETLVDSIGGGQGSLIIPRRILRVLVGGARPALIATVLAVLFRCLSRGRGGFRSRGRVKSSWITRVFGVDLRRVKQARKNLVELGWIVPEEHDQWSENRWGRSYQIVLDWDRIAPPDGRGLPPPLAADGRGLPPPDSDLEPLREIKNQEPASGGPAEFWIPEAAEERDPPSPPSGDRAVGDLPVSVELPAAPASLVTVSLRPVGSPPDSVPRVEASVRTGAGEVSLPEPTLNDVRVEDLKSTVRLLGLLAQAIRRDLVGPSEADRFRFVAAAEHALSVGKQNPPGLFMYLVRSRLWRSLRQEDEDRASRRLKSHQLGPARVVGGPCLRPGGPTQPQLSMDARLVSELKAAMIRAGIFRDPFGEFRRLNPDWTRDRWDAALAELAGGDQNRTRRPFDR